MRRFLLGTIAIVGLIGVLTGVSIAVGARQIAPEQVNIPARLLPGQPSPKDGSCYWYPYEYERTCELTGTPWTFYEIDMSTQKIHAVVIETKDHTLGDMINQWGTPVGANYTSYSIDVFWANGLDAWIYNDPLSPNVSVYFVSLTSGKPPPMGPWRGFR